MIRNRFLLIFALTALGLAGSLTLTGQSAFADSPHHYFRMPMPKPDGMSMTREELEGKTLQRITQVGLRWFVLEKAGRWTALNERGRRLAGSWDVRDGRLCMNGSEWFPKPSCYTFYGIAGKVVGVTSEISPGLFQPASLFVTDDPSDGVGETMSATHAAAGAFPFPARTSKLFFQKHELEGWRIEMATGSGDWFEFRPGGRLHQGSGGETGPGGKWEINQYGELCVTIGRFRKETTCYDLLGSAQTGVVGMRNLNLPFRYYPVQAHRVGS